MLKFSAMDSVAAPTKWRDTTGIILAGLAMSVGWGFRGDYGHEAGAMIPGALLALAICIGSGREDWLNRAPVIALCGAIGWAFGGQMSYGRIIGYTAGSSLPDVAYGYASLFLIGGLWAGIGSGMLTMSLTQPSSYLRRFVGPLIMLVAVWLFLDLSGRTDLLVERWYFHDTDWVAALAALFVAFDYAIASPKSRPACTLIALLAIFWCLGYLVLTQLLGLRMTPPRSDNWSGCVGLFIGLILYLLRRRDRAAVTMMAWGFLAGGLGFLLGDFANMLGRAQWGPIGRFEFLQGLDYWKWMEQLFGLIMGLGVSAAFLRILRPKLRAPAEDRPARSLRTAALLFLLVYMFWLNLPKNLKTWLDRGDIPEQLFGADIRYVFLTAAIALSAIPVLIILYHHRRQSENPPPANLRPARLLFLAILWTAVIGALLQALSRVSSRNTLFVHLTFWITAAACSLIAICFLQPPRTTQPVRPTPQPVFKTTWKYWLCCALVPPLILLVSYLTVRSHAEELPGSHLRFNPKRDPSAAAE